MGTLGALLKHPEDFLVLVKMMMASSRAKRQIPPQPHWACCYTMLTKVSRSFALVIQQLGEELRDAVELSTTKSSWINFTMFQRPSWSLGKETIEDITKRMGAGMAKFICMEVETISDYDEYCYYVAGLVGLGLSKLFHASRLEDLTPDDLSNCTGNMAMDLQFYAGPNSFAYLQKTNIIRDYLEDINEIPKSRMFWPREIWNKYVDKLEDLKYEENSVVAVKCLNEMVTNALTHMEDCLRYMSALNDPNIFRFCAIPQIMAIGTLALCYNNIQVFRGVVKMRRGLVAKVVDQTKTMSDVYGAFFDFSSLLQSKIMNFFTMDLYESSCNKA
ncbi:hypothetical protein EJ110_NYTH00931 [Nymphaea thermarum]|nr:hypothetical protein EJ110_NYTH00931 [Nymphaea thermarum]